MILAALAVATTLLASSAPPLGVDMPPGMPVARDPACLELPILISVDEAGEISFRGKPLATEKVVPTLRAAAAKQTCRGDEIYIQAANAAPYARIQQILWMLKAGGLDTVGFIVPYEAY